MTGSYLVFGGRKWENVMGKRGMTWDIIGVFQADDPERACLIAAQKAGVGTCVAVEAYAWGVDTVDAGDVPELGVEADAITRLERMGERLGERLARALPAVTQRELESGDDDGER